MTWHCRCSGSASTTNPKSSRTSGGGPVKPRTFALAAIAILASAAAAAAQETPAEYQKVLTTLGKTGDFKDNVLKGNLARNDVKVTVASVDTPRPFGFGGWIALTRPWAGDRC